jgi:oligoendopeptidase F
VDEGAEIARRCLRRKAALLGVEKLGFQDLMAPLSLRFNDRLDWSDGQARVIGAFESVYPDLARFASQALERRWVDHSPRAGKAPGGFCSTSPVLGESRIFMTFNGAAGDVATLAHELGHAWHGWLLRDARFWSRHYPMTLAETASTFAQQIAIDAVLDHPAATAEARAVMLDARMQDAETFLLNIRMRFLFESAMYEERASGELSVERLCELMARAQREVYGDTLDPEQLDPFFWASKLHFYIAGVSFYNFPYTFGYLFSLGLFARARAEGPGFLPRYEQLLRETGRGSVEEVVSSCLGIDLRQPDFWQASIALIGQDLERWLAVVDELDLAPGPDDPPSQSPSNSQSA